MKSPNRPSFLIAAHRGTAGGNIPCNSLTAYELALQDGADIIELDVACSLDGQLFCFHPGKEPVMYRDPTPISQMTGADVAKRFLCNQDHDETIYCAPSFDEALELLKGRCQVAVDKFWTKTAPIADCIRRHGMEDQVLCKLQNKPEQYRVCRELAPDLPVLPLIRRQDETEALRHGLRVAGVEVLFEREDEPVASSDYLAVQHRLGRLVWVNAIVYNKEDILSAGHTDDRAVQGDRDGSWGWLIDRGYDIIQTDWTAQLARYRAERQEKEVPPWVPF